MLKMLRPKVRVIAIKAIAIRAVVMVMGRPVVRPIPWMPMSSRGI